MNRVLVVALLVLTPVRAFADAKAEATQHVAKAMEFHKANRFKEALDELMFAYSLEPRPDLLYAIAQVHVKLGNCAQAITFYERFLTTHPAAGPAASAREAIDVCNSSPPPLTEEPAPEPIKPAEPLEPIKSIKLPEPVITVTTRPFYTDVIGDALVGTGIVSGVVGLVMYRGALANLDAAEAAPDYASHAGLVDSAHGKRTLAVMFGIGGGALVGVGVARFVLGDRTTRETHNLALIPVADGGLVTWSGTFR